MNLDKLYEVPKAKKSNVRKSIDQLNLMTQTQTKKTKNSDDEDNQTVDTTKGIQQILYNKIEFKDDTDYEKLNRDNAQFIKLRRSIAETVAKNNNQRIHKLR